MYLEHLGCTLNVPGDSSIYLDNFEYTWNLQFLHFLFSMEKGNVHPTNVPGECTWGFIVRMYIECTFQFIEAEHEAL